MSLLRPRHLVVLIAGLCTQAFAQQSATDGPMQQVEVKGAGYDARRDDTAARIVVKREEVVRYGDVNVADVLKRIPGVTVTVGAGRSTQIRMRGLGGGYTQILVNGERTPAGFALDTLSPDMIERIEVLRVATAEFSSESVAGTINIVLRKKTNQRQREAKLGYLLSNDFRGPTFSTQLGDRSEEGKGASWALSASGNHDSLEREFRGFEENTRPGGAVDLYRRFHAREKGHMNRLNLSPRLNWTLDNGDTLAWESMFNSNSFRNGSHAVVTTLAGRPPQTPDLHGFGEFDDRTLKSDLGWTRTMASGLKLDAKLGAEWSSNKSFVRRSGLDAAGMPETEGSTLKDTHARGVNSTGKATRSLDGGHVLAMGWDLRVNASSEIRVERDRVRVFAPGQLLDENVRARVGRAALYVQDEWTIDPQWSVYLGTRWEGVRTSVSGNAVESTRVRSSVLSPVLQTLYKFPDRDGQAAKGQSDGLRLAVSRTYKAPDLGSIVPLRAEWENNSATEADYQGNPALRPELAWGIDAAWEHYWAEGAMLSVSGALRRIDDYTSNRVYFDGRRWIYTPVNDGRAVMRSLELETKFPLKALFADAPAIDLRASVSRNWSQVESVRGPYNRMEQQIPLSANLGVDYKSGALALGSSVAYRRGGYVQVAANRGFYRIGRTDLDAYAAWTFNPKTVLRVALSNLLEVGNSFEPSYDDPVTGLEKRRWNYPNGVKLRTTLEMKF